MNDLLTPSLSETTQRRPIYSARAAFWVAFLGGPFAIVLFTGLNARRLGRLTREWPLLLCGVLVFAGLAFVYFHHPQAFGLAPQSNAEMKQTFRLGSRGLALLFWLGAYALHKPYHRNQAMIGMDAPSPWKAAIGAIVAGGVLTAVMAIALLAPLLADG